MPRASRSCCSSSPVNSVSGAIVRLGRPRRAAASRRRCAARGAGDAPACAAAPASGARDALGEQLEVVALAPLGIEQRVVRLLDALRAPPSSRSGVNRPHTTIDSVRVHLAHALVGAADLLVAGAGIDLEHLVERLLLGARAAPRRRRRSRSTREQLAHDALDVLRRPSTRGARRPAAGACAPPATPRRRTRGGRGSRRARPSRRRPAERSCAPRSRSARVRVWLTTRRGRKRWISSSTRSASAGSSARAPRGRDRAATGCRPRRCDRPAARRALACRAAAAGTRS